MCVTEDTRKSVDAKISKTVKTTKNAKFMFTIHSKTTAINLLLYGIRDKV